MRILLIHNFFKELGGEDKVVAAEYGLLVKYGHKVDLFTAENRYIRSFKDKFETAWRLAYSTSSYRLLGCKIREFRPDLVQVQNLFPLLTPSIYDACREAGIPIVQRLANYRIFCPGSLFMRDGRICEDCMSSFPFRAVLHRCYRDSILGSLAVAWMVYFHRRRRTWQKKVDYFIALSEFAKSKFIQGGLPSFKIVVKPNFVYPDPGAKAQDKIGKYVLFVGRFSHEKGLTTLIDAWRGLRGVPLKIVGDGPLRSVVEDKIERYELKEVKVLGHCSHKKVFELMKGARFLVFPSECYENFGLVAVEAFACGIPVIATSLVAGGEIIEDGRTGLYFVPGATEDLAEKVEWAWTYPKETARMGWEARRDYEEKYTPERNYEMLMEIYEMALGRARGKMV